MKRSDERSRAAKKGWETRRKKAESEAKKKAARSAAAKKAWETRRRNAKPKVVKDAYVEEMFRRNREALRREKAKRKYFYNADAPLLTKKEIRKRERARKQLEDLSLSETEKDKLTRIETARLKFEARKEAAKLAYENADKAERQRIKEKFRKIKEQYRHQVYRIKKPFKEELAERAEKEKEKFREMVARQVETRIRGGREVYESLSDVWLSYNFIDGYEEIADIREIWEDEYGSPDGEAA